MTPTLLVSLLTACGSMMGVLWTVSNGMFQNKRQNSAELFTQAMQLLDAKDNELTVLRKQVTILEREVRRLKRLVANATKTTPSTTHRKSSTRRTKSQEAAEQ